ncbi:MAG: hypothetical protein M1839_008555 [Geoglossum umbratile]|nr:MAG: hypothetical protein M1839_008555 [Geoglossum umbratile]
MAPNRKPKRSDNHGADDAEQRRRDKKRVQNRLSQQCSREKQVSYIKQLERFVEDIRSPEAGLEDPQAQLQHLQKKHLALMKENQKLREASLRMRKKLLSLSCSASLYAEDATGGGALAGDSYVKRDEDISSDSSSLRSPKSDGHTAPIQNFVNRKALPALPEFHCVPTPNFTLDQMYAPNHATTQITQMTNSPATGMGNLATILPAAPLMDDTPSIAVLTPLTCAAIDSPSPLQSLRTVGPATAGGIQPPYASLVPPSMLDAGHSSAPYYPMPAQGYLKTTHTPEYHDALVCAIERTAREVVEKMRFAVFNNVWAEVGVSPRSFSQKQLNEIDQMTLADICKTSLRIMLKCSILEKYPYMMGTALLTEKILRWRIQPTPENRAAIPEPFHPTTLQQLVIDRPASLDFIHFGDLRDQLIIYMGAYDARSMHGDSIKALVREIPTLGIALPILEFYHGLVEKTNAQGMVEVNGEDEIGSEEYDPHAPYQPCASASIKLARTYGLHRLSERKLDPAFGNKYPFLDVRSITTRCPIVRWQDIGRYETLLLKDPSINA